jgi:hypothetical protein
MGDKNVLWGLWQAGGSARRPRPERPRHHLSRCLGLSHYEIFQSLAIPAFAEEVFVNRFTIAGGRYPR